MQQAAACALGYYASQREASGRAEILAALTAMGENPNLHVRLEALAARAKMGDASTREPLRAAVEDGPEWRRLIARAALVALGEKHHFRVLHEQLMTELQKVDFHNSARPFEIIRLLGWCGDPDSLPLFEKVPALPCADVTPYDGGQQSRDILSACSLAKWRINRHSPH